MVVPTGVCLAALTTRFSMIRSSLGDIGGQSQRRSIQSAALTSRQIRAADGTGAGSQRSTMLSYNPKRATIARKTRLARDSLQTRVCPAWRSR
jgi:hypothetical protein